MRPRPSNRDLNAGTTLSRIIAAISAGTPGNEINMVPRHESQNPGADPTGLGTTVAPVGINACRSCPLLGDRPHCANRFCMASKASFRRASLRPAASAMASRVQSSTVGPRPPVITMIFARHRLKTHLDAQGAQFFGNQQGIAVGPASQEKLRTDRNDFGDDWSRRGTCSSHGYQCDRKVTRTSTLAEKNREETSPHRRERERWKSWFVLSDRSRHKQRRPRLWP